MNNEILCTYNVELKKIIVYLMHLRLFLFLIAFMITAKQTYFEFSSCKNVVRLKNRLYNTRKLREGGSQKKVNCHINACEYRYVSSKDMKNVYKMT